MNKKDEQEISNSTYVDGNEINLYAKWTQTPIYTVAYNANGGNGSMSPQQFEVEVAQNLKISSFTKENGEFWKWKTTKTI